MRTKLFFSAGVLLLCAACASQQAPKENASRGPASEIAHPGDENPEQSDRAVPKTETCHASMAAVALLKTTENKFHSTHRWGQTIKDVYKACMGIERLHFGGPAGWKELKRFGWNCALSDDPLASPINSIVFEDSFAEVHILNSENKSCFASDFRRKDCLPMSAIHHKERKTYGWCQP